jgi:hypothetical protein
MNSLKKIGSGWMILILATLFAMVYGGLQGVKTVFRQPQQLTQK